MQKYGINSVTPSEWDRLQKEYPALKADEVETTVLSNDACMDKPSSDPVESPTHYNSGSIECIDAIKESMSEREFRGYLKGNVMKYLWRYDRKVKGKAKEDLKKADWYLNRLIDEIKG